MPQNRSYLQLRGETWYARVIVPPSLSKQLGTHLRKSLRTKSLPEANRRKHVVIAELKNRIAQAKLGTSYKDWRAYLRNASSEQERDEIELQIIEEAEELEAKKGEKEALTFFRKATQVKETLSELTDMFLGLKQHSADSLKKHKKALDELRAHFEDDDTAPINLAPQKLLQFVDQLVDGPLAPNTKRDRLGSLGMFWEWLERRLHVPKNSNPFRGVSVRGGNVQDSRAFTSEEVFLLLASDFPIKWQRQAFIIILLTGARPSEILGLRFRDIDAGAHTIRISLAKTEAGVRTLPYRHPLLVQIIESLRSEADPTPDARLFSGGGPEEKPAKNFINWFSRHRKRIGLPEGVSLYSTRKTFISKCLDLGLDVVNVERYVGHKNPRLALNVYSKGRSDAGLIAVAEGIASGWHLQRFITESHP